MPIDGLYAADEDTMEPDDPIERDSDEPPRPLRSDHDWDDPDLIPPPQSRSSYEDIPYTD